MAWPPPREVVKEKRPLAWCVFLFVMTAYIVYCSFVVVRAVQRRKNPPVTVNFESVDTVLPDFYLCPNPKLAISKPYATCRVNAGALPNPSILSPAAYTYRPGGFQWNNNGPREELLTSGNCNVTFEIDAFEGRRCFRYQLQPVRVKKGFISEALLLTLAYNADDLDSSDLIYDGADLFLRFNEVNSFIPNLASGGADRRILQQALAPNAAPAVPTATPSPLSAAAPPETTPSLSGTDTPPSPPPTTTSGGVTVTPSPGLTVRPTPTATPPAVSSAATLEVTQSPSTPTATPTATPPSSATPAATTAQPSLNTPTDPPPALPPSIITTPEATLASPPLTPPATTLPAGSTPLPPSTSPPLAPPPVASAVPPTASAPPPTTSAPPPTASAPPPTTSAVPPSAVPPVAAPPPILTPPQPAPPQAAPTPNTPPPSGAPLSPSPLSPSGLAPRSAPPTGSPRASAPAAATPLPPQIPPDVPIPKDFSGPIRYDTTSSVSNGNATAVQASPAVVAESVSYDSAITRANNDVGSSGMRTVPQQVAGSFFLPSKDGTNAILTWSVYEPLNKPGNISIAGQFTSANVRAKGRRPYAPSNQTDVIFLSVFVDQRPVQYVVEKDPLEPLTILAAWGGFWNYVMAIFAVVFISLRQDEPNLTCILYPGELKNLLVQKRQEKTGYAQEVVPNMAVAASGLPARARAAQPSSYDAEAGSWGYQGRQGFAQKGPRSGEVQMY